MKPTEWYPGYIHPAHNGWYQRKAHPTSFANPEVFYSFWINGTWYYEMYCGVFMPSTIDETALVWRGHQ